LEKTTALGASVEAAPAAGCLRQIPRDHQQKVIYIGWFAAAAIAFMRLAG